jgi:hypothetical protein
MVKYFAVVDRPPAYALVVLACATALGLATLWMNPRELDSSLGMVLFVHMLMTSSGFAPSARRGHFDPMLVHGRSRTAAVVAHWAASILPGAVAWAMLGTTGVLLHSAGALSALAGSRLVAFWAVSAMAWSAGFLLPRGAGGAIWISLLMTLLLWHPDLLGAPMSHTPWAIARVAATLVACPFLLLGERVPVGVPHLAAATGLAAVVLLLTWRAGARLDVFLVERS